MDVSEFCCKGRLINYLNGKKAKNKKVQNHKSSVPQTAIEWLK